MKKSYLLAKIKPYFEPSYKAKLLLVISLLKQFLEQQDSQEKPANVKVLFKDFKVFCDKKSPILLDNFLKSHPNHEITRLCKQWYNEVIFGNFPSEMWKNVLSFCGNKQVAQRFFLVSRFWQEPWNKAHVSNVIENLPWAKRDYSTEPRLAILKPEVLSKTKPQLPSDEFDFSSERTSLDADLNRGRARRWLANAGLVNKFAVDMSFVNKFVRILKLSDVGSLYSSLNQKFIVIFAGVVSGKNVYFYSQNKKLYQFDFKSKQLLSINLIDIETDKKDVDVQLLPIDDHNLIALLFIGPEKKKKIRLVDAVNKVLKPLHTKIDSQSVMVSDHASEIISIGGKCACLIPDISRRKIYLFDPLKPQDKAVVVQCEEAEIKSISKLGECYLVSFHAKEKFIIWHVTSERLTRCFSGQDQACINGYFDRIQATAEGHLEIQYGDISHIFKFPELKPVLVPEFDKASNVVMQRCT